MAKRISKSKMVKITNAYKATNSEIYLPTSDGENVPVVVKKSLSYGEMIQFVDTAVNMCIIDGEYHPEVFDMAYGTCVLAFYTNLNLEDGETTYTFIHSEAYNLILNEISENLTQSVQKRIDAVVSKSSENSKLDDTLDVIISLAKTAQEKISGMDGNIDIGELLDIGNKLSNKSEEEIVKAVIAEKGVANK